MNETHAVLILGLDVVKLAMSTQDIMGRVVSTLQAAEPMPLNGEITERSTYSGRARQTKRHQAIGVLVALAVKHGATSIEIIIDKD